MQKVSETIVELAERHIAFCLDSARKRQGNAVRESLKPHNNAPNDPATALRLHFRGLKGECAAYLYLRPITWLVFREGRDFVEPDLQRGSLCIDVKCREKNHHRLMVQKDDDASWAYVLACAHAQPVYGLVGWCYGHEAKQGRFWEDPKGGRPAYFIGAHNPVMKPMAELLRLVRAQDSSGE